MSKRKTHVPPSRERYERDNPTVTCRITREEYNLLEEIKAVGGDSNADIFRLALGKAQDRNIRESMIWKRGHSEGYKKGFAEAEKRFKIVIPCAICREPIEIISDLDTKALAEQLCRNGFGHVACHNRRR